MRRFFVFLFLAGASVAVLGCDGANNVKVQGRLLKGGARYTPPAGHDLSIIIVTFDVHDENGKPVTSEPFEAILDDNGENFSVPGREGYGIPPGKYRIAITQRMNRVAFETEKPKTPPGLPEVTRETDFLWGQFSVDKSPIFRDVDGSTEIVIDLDNPK